MEYLVYTKTCTRYIIRPLMEPEKHRNGWVIGLIVGSLVAFVLPLLIIIPISGLNMICRNLICFITTKALYKDLKIVAFSLLTTNPIR